MRLTAMDKSSEILRFADELEQFLRDNKIPAPNPYAVHRVRDYCSQLGELDHYVEEKADDIEDLAVRFYKDHGFSFR